jgi:hypothetical protein
MHAPRYSRRNGCGTSVDLIDDQDLHSDSEGESQNAARGAGHS